MILILLDITIVAILFLTFVINTVSSVLAWQQNKSIIINSGMQPEEVEIVCKARSRRFYMASKSFVSFVALTSYVALIVFKIAIPWFIYPAFFLISVGLFFNAVVAMLFYAGQTRLIFITKKERRLFNKTKNE